MTMREGFMLAAEVRRAGCGRLLEMGVDFGAAVGYKSGDIGIVVLQDGSWHDTAGAN